MKQFELAKIDHWRKREDFLIKPETESSKNLGLSTDV